MFTTERLLLRGFEDSDLDHLLALRNDARVQRAKTFGPVVPRPPKYKDFLKSLAEDSALWFTVTLRETEEFMGHCNIRIHEPKNRDGEFSISMYPKFWGKGYGTEATRFTVGYAFSALGLQRLSLSVLEGNAAARGLYSKIGFREEGRKRRGNWAEGHWEDIIDMGILDEEWIAQQNKTSTS
ncbi:acyl-CoA N-acyltransferase [Paxillus ammoniavirescens]|nr:acyl-CoA N-acyltransferase [Paxillus ammoniavirescens]